MTYTIAWDDAALTLFVPNYNRVGNVYYLFIIIVLGLC